MSISDSFNNLPTPAKVGLAIIGGGGLLYGISMIFPQSVMIILLAGVPILIALLVGLNKAWEWWKKKTSNRLFRPASKNSTDLERKFFDGLAKVKKDTRWHQKPWYIIAGEPGAGKTESLRHRSSCLSGVNKDDATLGVGGNQGMDWWFKDDAIILDTAGALVMNGAEPGESDAWVDFLKLVAKNKPECPINGLILAIPASSLLSDTPLEMEQKAAKLARKFSLIERHLGVRVPAYVLITKSDLIPGFREFSESVSSNSQHQIFGWSNPLPLSETLRPQTLPEQMTPFINRLRRRRLGLLRQPPHLVDAIRPIDSVDALYTFPEELAALLPALTRYIEIIFPQYAEKPVFFRGVYLTSSMREGEEIDKALQRLAPEKTLASARQWDSDGNDKKAFFIKDLWVKKVFRESGLVSRSLNPLRQQAWRKAAVLSLLSVAIVLLTSFTYVGYSQFSESIGKDCQLWTSAAQSATADKSMDFDLSRESPWCPLIEPKFDRGPSDVYHGQSPSRLASLSRISFVQTLLESSHRKIDIPHIFAWSKLRSDIKDKAPQAAAVFCTESMIRPAVNAAVDKMLANQATSTTNVATTKTASFLPAKSSVSPDEFDALRSLLCLKVDYYKMSLQSPSNFDSKFSLTPLLKFAVAQKDSNRESLLQDAPALERLFKMFRDIGAKWPVAISDQQLEHLQKAVATGIDHIKPQLDNLHSPEMRQLQELLKALKATDLSEQQLLLLKKDPLNSKKFPQIVDDLNKNLSHYKILLEKHGSDNKNLILRYKEASQKEKSRLLNGIDLLMNEIPEACRVNQPAADRASDRSSRLGNHLVAIFGILSQSRNQVEQAMDAVLAATDKEYGQHAAMNLEALQERLKVYDKLSVLCKWPTPDIKLITDSQIAPDDSWYRKHQEKFRIETADLTKVIAETSIAWKAQGSGYREVAAEVCVCAEAAFNASLVRSGFENLIAAANGKCIDGKVVVLDGYLLPAKPSIQMVRMKDGKFLSEPGSKPLIPEYCQALITSYKSLSAEVNQKDLPKEVKDKLQAAKSAVDSYATEFVEYWTRTVLYQELLASEKCSKEWSDWAAGFRQMDPDTQNMNLEVLGKLVLNVLNTAGIDDPSLASSKTAKERKAAIEASLAKLQTDVFKSACADACRKWRELAKAPIAADARRLLINEQNVLILLKPSQLDPNPDNRYGFVGACWRNLILAGLSHLAEAYQDDVKDILVKLTKAVGFPVVATEGRPSLNLDQIESIRTMLVKIEAGQLPDIYIDREIGNLISRIFVPELPDGDKLWVQKVKNVVDGLPHKNQDSKVTVLIPAASKQPRDFYVWIRYIGFEQGTVLKALSTEQADLALLGEFGFGNGISVRFSRFIEDVEKPKAEQLGDAASPETRILKIDDIWPFLRLLHQGQDSSGLKWQASRDDKDPKMWTVKFTLPDDNLAKHPFLVQLKFDKPLPNIADWPGLPGVDSAKRN